jgi:predicted nucleic acid-binding protein
MRFFLDTGILLRLANPDDPQYPTVEQAIEQLVNSRSRLYAAVQNVAEYWCVTTRPTDRNGFGLSAASVSRSLEEIIEPVCTILSEHREQYRQFKRLGLKYEFLGKQAHDARLVATMLCWGIDRIVTLNERDFRRYEPEGIIVVTPDSILA